MALDEYFLNRTEEGSLPGMLRLYSWLPGSISVGRFFKTPLFDLDTLKAEGVRLVRRLSGGSAIYHNKDLTYSLIIPQGCRGLSDKREYYLFIASILKQALATLNIATLIKDKTEVREGTADCFSSVSQYEITDSEGCKLVGSAQKIGFNSLLQHGSIFYAYDPALINRYFKVSVKGKTNWNSYRVDHSTLLKELKRAFSLHFQLEEYTLTTEDRAALDRLVESKYALEEWNLAR